MPKKGRGWTKGQSAEFRELEEPLILPSSRTEIWSGCYSTPAPPHLPGHTCGSRTPKKHVELCPEPTEAEELA